MTIPLLTSITDGAGLRIDAIKLLVNDADANNYVDRVRLVGSTRTGATDIIDDGSNRTAAGEYTITCTDTLLSSYDKLTVRVDHVCTTSADLRFVGVMARVYFAEV